MESRTKKAFKIIGILIACIVGIILIFYIVMAILSDFLVQGQIKAYNQILPSTEIELPYNIHDYECVYLSDWHFDSLTAKVKERKRDADFWVYRDNYDILYSSYDKLYIRKDAPFTSDITADMVSEVAFSEALADKDPIKFVPNFTKEEITQFAGILLSDAVQTEKIPGEKYVAYDNGARILWDFLFQLKSTDEICYDGLTVTHDTQYWLVRDEDGTLYLKDSQNQYKPLPHELAEKIEQCYSKENLCLVAL